MFQPGDNEPQNHGQVQGQLNSTPATRGTSTLSRGMFTHMYDVAHHLYALVERAVLVVLGERVLLQVVVLDEPASGGAVWSRQQTVFHLKPANHQRVTDPRCEKEMLTTHQVRALVGSSSQKV